MIDVSDLPLDLPLPRRGAAPALLGLQIQAHQVRMNMVEYYEVLRQVTGWQSPT